MRKVVVMAPPWRNSLWTVTPPHWVEPCAAHGGLLAGLEGDEEAVEAADDGADTGPLRGGPADGAGFLALVLGAGIFEAESLAHEGGAVEDVAEAVDHEGLLREGLVIENHGGFCADAGGTWSAGCRQLRKSAKKGSVSSILILNASRAHRSATRVDARP
jgi:hypothetical protein